MLSFKRIPLSSGGVRGQGSYRQAQQRLLTHNAYYRTFFCRLCALAKCTIIYARIMLSSVPCFFSGISVVVAVVGTKRLFVLCKCVWCRLLHTAGTRMCMCLLCVGLHNTKSMTEKNRGGASLVCNCL